MNLFFYKLTCEDCGQVICSDRVLDLPVEVDRALRALTFDQVVDPTEDWFQTLVGQVCEQTGAVRLEVTAAYDCEDAYFEEVRSREDARACEEED